jgi:hypothetical protein
VTGRTLPKGADGRALRCGECGGRPSHGKKGNPRWTKPAPCPGAPVFHEGVWGGRHKGTLAACSSKFCKKRVRGEALPASAVVGAEGASA